MDGGEQALLVKWAGLLLVLACVIDVYLTVLYARIGTGLLSPFINKGAWHVSRSISLLLGRRRGAFLQFVGPTLLVLIIAVWLCLIITGFALIVWPELADSIQASQGETPKDFATALYYSGFNFTTLGTGDIVPKSGVYRLLAVVEAAIGFSFFTLVITYFLSVYNAIRRRNTFALLLHHKSGGTGRPEDIMSLLLSDPTLQDVKHDFELMASQITDLTETHHIYPVLHYFRFRDSRYSLSRIALISMDSVSLLKTILDENRYAALLRSGTVINLWTSGMDMLLMISTKFLAQKFIHKHKTPPPDTIERWREHYLVLAQRLKTEGIGTATDLKSGSAAYVELRLKWHPIVAAIAESMVQGMEEVITGSGNCLENSASW